MITDLGFEADVNKLDFDPDLEKHCFLAEIHLENLNKDNNFPRLKLGQ